MANNRITWNKSSMRSGAVVATIFTLALLVGCDSGKNGEQPAQDQQGAQERTAPVGDAQVGQAPAQPATPPAAQPAEPAAPSPAAPPAEQPPAQPAQPQAQAPAQPQAQAPAAGGAALQAPPESAVDLAKGEQVYNQFCVACHSTGVAGSPKLDDKAAWAPRIAQGRDMLFTHAMQGLRAMPPKGTCVTCSETDIMSAIEFMTSKVK